ncbi:response regulator [Thermostilla marina]
MIERVLCVDDDPNVLQAYKRTLRKRYDLEVALGGEDGLKAVRECGPYAVVVSDMQMPGMNGIEFLRQVKEIAPETVRMMLTGNADQETAIQAVNEGAIFRFMTKPCPPETFSKMLDAGIEQYRLVTAEKELLSKTLAGSVRVLTEILTAVSPQAFGRASRVRATVSKLCKAMRVPNTWQVEIAAMLSQIGCVAVPAHILEKVYNGEELKPQEREIYESHPKLARELLAKIPRLDRVAEIVGYQEKHYDGSGFPEDFVAGDQIPLGSRILKLALDWDTLCNVGLNPEIALAEINDRDGWYDPKVVEAFRRTLNIEEVHVVRQVKIADLKDGTVLADDVVSVQGTLLCSKGQVVTPAIRLRLRNYAINVGISKPIRVYVPAKQAVQTDDAVDSFDDTSMQELSNLLE